MGNQVTKSFKEQEKAILEGEVSFSMNLYFIGEEIEKLYENFEKLKSQKKKDIFSYWNYYYHKGDYKSQLENIGAKFKENLEKFESDPVKNSFKEVVIVKMKERNDEKIEEIFDIFVAEKADVYSPFIIFFFDGDESQIEKVVPDEGNYFISPLKVFTFKYDVLQSESMNEFHSCLLRICSYYNELGEQFLIWPKDKDEPFAYDLINAEFNSYINIFCLGKTGSGKSTFLNKFFRAKKSKQGGTGKSTTTKIIRFGIDRIPIRIYDIPGFEGEETIDKVNKKLIQTTNEMNTDKDKIHLILYFINYKEETLIYEMENKIIETLKTNNKDIRIIFILTHSSIDPYNLPKEKRAINIFKDKLKKIINIISSTFGETYSYQTGYFEEGQLTQKNLIFVNLEKDYEYKVEPFGFDKVIRSIYNTLTEGNDMRQLLKIKEKLTHAMLFKIKNDNNLNKEIEDCLSKGYLLQHTSFSLQKEKMIKEAQKVYDGMFSLGMNLLTIVPVYRDVKLGVIAYHKYQFKKKLNKIFGFDLKNDRFDFLKQDETKYEKMNRNYLEHIENKKEIEHKKIINKEIKKDYNANEVGSGWIIANEVAGTVSYACLFGGPVLMAIGAIGLTATSIVSYQQFKKDCTEYFEQYKKHYEEYKYFSLYNFIVSLLMGIEYLESYIISLEDKAAPNVGEVIDNIRKSIEVDIKTAKGNATAHENENELRSNIPFLN